MQYLDFINFGVVKLDHFMRQEVEIWHIDCESCDLDSREPRFVNVCDLTKYRTLAIACNVRVTMIATASNSHPIFIVMK